MTKILKAIVPVISALLLTLPAYAQEVAGEQMKQEALREEVKQQAPLEQIKQDLVKGEAKQAPAGDEVKPEPAKAAIQPELGREQAKPETAKDEAAKGDSKGEPAKESAQREPVQDQAAQEPAKDQKSQDPAKDAAKEIARKEQSKGLDEQVQEIKTDVLRIATELNRLEEKLLYPSDTQIAVFVSLAGAEKYRLDAVDIELDGKAVAHHLYTFKELEALQKGGVQRIHVGNLRTGDHPLRVTVSGKTAGGSDFQKQESFKITKGIGPKLVGVVLAGTGIGSKTITVKDW